MREHLRKAFAEINQFAAVLEEKVAERTEQLRRTNQKLMQTDRLTSLGQLAASVAHEINNPLSGVLNLSMLMQRIVGENGIPPERVAEVKRYLNQISTETARVGRIVTDLLAFSRRSRPHRTNADLNTIIRSSTNLLAHKIKLANATLTLQLQETLPTLMCDPSQMQQVIINLVMNAADAVQARGGGTVTVRTSAATDHVKLDVADTGEGIAEENLSKIFDPFFTTKAEGKGSGLGLAVVYGIVDAHGGVIDVTSSVGVGTTFGITLPLEHDPAEAVLGPVAAAPAPRSDA
jgi:signal transduction histidine kinase